MDSHDNAPLHRRRIVALVLLSVLGVWLRFLRLGHASPWLDEASNWLIAEENGPAWREGGHPLSYLAIWIGLRVSDSQFGLRLQAAIAGSAAMILATAWTLRRAGLGAGIVAGMLLAFSPYCLFFSRDANHYAPIMLGGVIAVCGLDWSFIDGRLRVRRWLLAAGSLLFLVGFHPVGAIVLGSFLLTSYAMLLRRPSGIHSRLSDTSRVRLLLLLAGLVVVLAGVAFAYRLRIFENLVGNPIGAVRRVGFTWDFWSALLADFAGALSQRGFADIALGFLFAGGSLLGWVRLARAGSPAALAFAVLFACHFGFFYFLESSHYFYPKFMAAVVPPLLIGVAVALSWCLPLPRMRFAAAAVLMLFAWRAGVWQVAHFRNDHQPTLQAIRHLAEETPPDSIVVTRNDYTSRAFRFLWTRAGHSPTRHEAVSWLERCGAPSIQQIREIRHDHPEAEIYFVSFLETREQKAEDFAEFLEVNSEVAIHLPSASPNEFVGFDRSITIRKVNLPPDDSSLALPRAGAEASSIAGEQMVVGTARAGGSRIELPPFTGTTYRLAESPAKAILVDYEVVPGPNMPMWIVAGIARADQFDSGTLAFIHSVDRESPRRGTLRIALEDSVPEGLLSIYVVGTFARTKASARFVPLMIRSDEVEADSDIAMSQCERLPPSWVEARTTPKPDGFHGWNVGLERPIGEEEILLATQWVHVDGLPDRAALLKVSYDYGRKRTLGAALTWTRGWNLVAGRVEMPAGSQGFGSVTGSTRMHSNYPRGVGASESLPQLNRIGASLPAE